MSGIARKLKRALLAKMYDHDRFLTPVSKMWVNTQRQKLAILRRLKEKEAYEAATAVEQRKGR